MILVPLNFLRNRSGFTLVELLTVVVIIIALAALTVQVAGYANRRSAVSRAQAEIAALEAALESYKADNGAYPVFSGTSLWSGTNYNGNPSSYNPSSATLYAALSGDANRNRQIDSPSESGLKTYFEFKDSMLTPSTGNVQAIIDPFGYSYGYTTLGATSGTQGFNPTFDLWSTGGRTGNADIDRANWVTNWN